jgi:type I restriction enzyme M protein
MATKRDVLAHLTRDELLAVVDRFTLSVPDRRAKEGLVEAVAASKKATLAEILPGYARERLKELCRALGLDDGGKEKAPIVERIVGGGGGSKSEGAPSVRPSAGKPSAAAAPAGEQIELSLGAGKLTIDALERYLWSAADILRGSIDSSDYKGFIFGLLFLKRLSDRFEEECEALVAAGDDPEDRDNHQFFVPKRARWAEIQRTATNVGEALNKACSALEGENKSLEGVLAGIDFNDERKLGDAKSRDVVLGKLVQHFAKVALKNANLSEPDMLGRAYEYLIEKFADDAGKKGGEFYTPKKVVELLVEILAPREGMRICDPTCGSGGMLIQSAHYLARHKQDPKNTTTRQEPKEATAKAPRRQEIQELGVLAPWRFP